MKGMTSSLTKCVAIFLLTSLIAFGISSGAPGGQSQTPPGTSLNIKLVSGLTAEEQRAVITGYGGVIKSWLPKLNLITADVPTGDLSNIMNNLQSDPLVVRVEINKIRKV